MADTQTQNYGFTVIEVGPQSVGWPTKINNNTIAFDNALKNVENKAEEAKNKVAIDVMDTNPGTLSEKIDGETIKVNTENKLQASLPGKVQVDETDLKGFLQEKIDNQTLKVDGNKKLFVDSSVLNFVESFAFTLMMGGL